MSFIHSSSVSILTPSFLASASFEPRRYVLLHCLVNSCSHFLVRVFLRSIACFFCAGEAFLANLGNLVFRQMTPRHRDFEYFE
jgi:hypothetical protein